MTDKIKIISEYIQGHSMAACTIVFCIVYLVAWYCNGKLGMHFSCGDLMILYTTIIAKELGMHAINSVCNSPKGEPPER